jgi:surface antigen
MLTFNLKELKMRKLTSLIILIGIVCCFGCSNLNKAQQGAGLGAMSGALVGSMTSHGDTKATLIGAGIGLGVGYIIGNEWDKYDEQQVEKTLETCPSNQSVTWKNPDSGNTYKATPKPAKVENNKVYRDIEIESYVDGKKELVIAKAYRNQDGRWVLKQ